MAKIIVFNVTVARIFWFISYTLQKKLIVRIVHESRKQELHFMYIHFFLSSAVFSGL